MGPNLPLCRILMFAFLLLFPSFPVDGRKNGKSSSLKKDVKELLSNMVEVKWNLVEVKAKLNGVVPIGTYGNGNGKLIENWSTENLSGVTGKNESRRISQLTVWEQTYEGKIVCAGLQFQYEDQVTGNNKESSPQYAGGSQSCAPEGCQIGKQYNIPIFQKDNNPIIQIDIWANTFINKLVFATGQGANITCGRSETGSHQQLRPTISGQPGTFIYLSG